MLVFIVFAAIWQFATTDLFGFGHTIQSLIGIDLLSARGNANTLEFIACIFLTGFNIGVIGTITAHELTHRTADRISLFIGRWLLAFSFDASFSIEHVYAHHRYVSTINDPATDTLEIRYLPFHIHTDNKDTPQSHNNRPPAPFPIA